MNIYVVVEGKSERRVYPTWIPLVNPTLSPVNDLDEVRENNYYLVSAGGYPQIYDVIDAAIQDVNNFFAFDRLVISVDSDESTFNDRLQEIKDFLLGKNCRTEVRIIIQHFCFETWALGNRHIIRRHPQNHRLQNYLNLFDVRSNDPELLPSNQQIGLTRSKFAKQYLKAMINDRYVNITYTKSNPSILMNNGYFNQVNSRLQETGHIASFTTFLDAFS